MSSEIHWSVCGSEFEAFINQHRNQLTMVHFWADWNPLDPPMFQVFEEIHAALGTDVALGRVRVGPPENRDLCQWLGIVQVPTIVYVFRNRVIDARVGFSKNRLVGHVQMLLHSCLSASSEHPVILPPTPSEEIGYAGPGLHSPGFGTAVTDPSRLGLRGGTSPSEPRRFGLEVAQPVAPMATERQKKSWLSRWLSLD
jgi:thiol-disulfide isomerase/thioredoxin